MKVVVLCGGLGTRLREETEFRPKPMVEIGGHPILWHIMKIYAHYGLREFILCLGYRGNMIKDYFLNYEAMNNDFRISLGRQSHIEFMGAHQEQDFTVTLADTGLETMTGGRLQRVARYIGNDDTFLLTYGDILVKPETYPRMIDRFNGEYPSIIGLARYAQARINLTERRYFMKIISTVFQIIFLPVLIFVPI